MVQLRLDTAREGGEPPSLGIVPVLPAELPEEWFDSPPKVCAARSAT
jgi:hypothetical protein